MFPSHDRGALDGYNNVPEGLNGDDADNKMISLALQLQKKSDQQIILITKDINFRVKCDALGIKSEDYYKDKVIQKESEGYKGFIELNLEKEHAFLIDLFYKDEDVCDDIEDLLGRKLYQNEFISVKCESQSFLAQKRMIF